MDDAVATALEQNLDLEVQRLTPVIRDTDVAAFKANYTPNFTSSVNLVDQSQPPSSFLSGNASQITNGRSSADFGISVARVVVGRQLSGAVEQRPNDDQ